MAVQVKSVVRRILKGRPVLLRAALSVYRSWMRLRLRLQVRSLPARLGSHYALTGDPEIIEILGNIRKNGLSMFPYEFTEKYKLDRYRVDFDATGLPFVVLFGRNVYFPRGLSAADVQAAVVQALLEQDPESPHRYLSPPVQLMPDDVVALVGASDGIFAASILDQVKRMYLFEPDREWTEPLGRTFAEDGDKVTIVEAFIGRNDSAGSLRLDTYFQSRGEQPSYIQADIEGGEHDLLLGAPQILQNTNLRVSLCCYHSDADQGILADTLRGSGLEVAVSRGYMLMWMQVPCKSPFLRRAVLHAYRRP